MDTGLEAIGTNAHELPMVYAAIAESDEALRDAPYDVLRDWAKMYGGNLLVVLPDCFGTTAFLEQAPDWVADWKGARPDSKPPVAGARELIDWWKARGRDPREKLVVLSDGMDINSIEDAVRALRGQVNVSIGWGTNLTNDFVGCAPGRRRRRPARDLARLQGGRGGRPPGRQALRQSQQGARARPRRSSAIAGYSARPEWRRSRFWCEGGPDAGGSKAEEGRPFGPLIAMPLSLELISGIDCRHGRRRFSTAEHARSGGRGARRSAARCADRRALPYCAFRHRRGPGHLVYSGGRPRQVRRIDAARDNLGVVPHDGRRHPPPLLSSLSGEPTTQRRVAALGGMASPRPASPRALSGAWARSCSWRPPVSSSNCS